MYSKKNKSDRKITDLEKRICDLENPYKYQIGDYVKVDMYNKENKVEGIVVKRNWDYYNNNHNFYFNFRINPDIEPYYMRKNFYEIYIESDKQTYTFDENVINNNIE